MRNVTLTIDGQSVTVPEDFTIIKAAKEIGIEIPALCYDPSLEIVSACRLCVVEIEGSNKLQTSCSIVVQDGMVVHTESDMVVKARREILQLLLDNHPNDCLTCQKAGECLLQDYSYKYGATFRNHGGARREGELVDTTSPYIIKDDSKCILCGKCVRTCYEVSDRKVLDFANRGFETKISADADLTLENSSCVACNRCVSVCPVGALLDKRMHNKVRSWEGEMEIVECKVCEYGCNFQVLSKNGKKIAVRAEEPTVGRPLCLKGRLTTEFIHIDNPEIPYKKVDGKYVETTWEEALGLEEIMNRLKK